MRDTTASCWKSFSPKYARDGPTTLNNLATTVHTPEKWVGRLAPSKRSESAGTATCVSTAPRPSGYISSSLGANTTAAPWSAASETSPSRSRG